jgi:crotonobetainyl-CoA:carnitine CoA-transferase CaiB-like acyl-CoA transferase
MYHSRMRSEAEASSSTKNRLLASSLTELLEGRKSVTNSAELETLAKRYHIDAAKLGQISRVVNTPSIDERTVVRTMDKHGEESLTMMVSWLS